MAALTNAQRQQRWRERHKTGDLLPPLNPASASETAKTVTPPTVTADAVTLRHVTVREHCESRIEVVAVRPCPFCGGIPRFCIDHGSKGPYVSAYCSECDATGPHDGPARTLEARAACWNRRPGQPGDVEGQP